MFVEALESRQLMSVSHHTFGPGVTATITERKHGALGSYVFYDQATQGIDFMLANQKRHTVNMSIDANKITIRQDGIGKIVMPLGTLKTIEFDALDSGSAKHSKTNIFAISAPPKIQMDLGLTIVIHQVFGNARIVSKNDVNVEFVSGAQAVDSKVPFNLDGLIHTMS